MTTYQAPIPAGAPSGSDGTGGPDRAGGSWGVDTSFFQARQPAFWLYSVLLVVCGYLFLNQQLVDSQLATAWLLSWALVLAYAVPVALIIYRLDLFEREPKMMLAAALIWGGVIATSLAIQANGAWLSVLGKATSPDFASRWGAAIVAPGVEETLKLAGVVTLFLIASSEFDGPMDGFVYGAMIGLGFTVVEDISYFINAVAAAPGLVSQSGPVLDTFFVRVVAGGLYGHVLFTGLTGLGFTYIATRRRVPLAVRVPRGVLCIAAGYAAHFIWNSPLLAEVLKTAGGSDPSLPQWIEYGTIKGMPFLLMLGILVLFATRSEEKRFREIVAGEPDSWVVTEPEIRSLSTLRARRSARIAANRRYGSAGSRLVGRLQASQIEYAMIRSRAGTLHDPELQAQRGKIHAIRVQMESLGGGFGPNPGAAAAAAAAAAPAAGAAVVPAATAAAAPTLFAATSSGGFFVVPAGGIPAWAVPHPGIAPSSALPAHLEVALVTRAGDWALVRTANGWSGWVDGRLLTPRP